MAYGGMRGDGAKPGKVVDANVIVDQVATLLKVPSSNIIRKPNKTAH